MDELADDCPVATRDDEIAGVEILGDYLVARGSKKRKREDGEGREAQPRAEMRARREDRLVQPYNSTTKALMMSRKDDWNTPRWCLDMVHRVLGEIGLDPSSSALANEAVQARQFFDVESDGLKSAWPSGVSVYLNPASGRHATEGSMPIAFWQRLMQHRDAGGLTDAIFFCFNISTLQSTHHHGVPPAAAFPTCILSTRVCFLSNATKQPERPICSNAFIYVPGTRDRTQLFVDVFREIGSMLLPTELASRRFADRRPKRDVV